MGDKEKTKCRCRDCNRSIPRKEYPICNRCMNERILEQERKEKNE